MKRVNARATVLLPGIEPQRQGESAAAAQQAQLAGRILVVDDEERIIDVLKN